MTKAPEKRGDSYRDPTLSDKWLAEAEWRAKNDFSRQFTMQESRTIICRLVQEIRNINRETGR